MPTGSQRILIVEDEPGLIHLLEKKLRNAGYDCATAATAQACRAWLAAHTPDLMLLDYTLPDRLAPVLVEELRQGGRLPPFIVITGHGDERVAVELMRLGARDYLVKDNLIFDRLTPVVQRTLREVEQELRLAAAEESLRKSEERFRAITCSSPDHVLMQDRELRYTFVLNPQLGLTEQDMLGKTDHELFAPADADQLTAIKRRVLDTGRSIQVEVPVASKSGEAGYFSGSYIARRGPEGEVDGLIGHFRNITAQRRAETALRESEVFRKRIFDSSRIAIVVMDAQTSRYLDCNPAAAAIYGHSATAEIVGKSPLDFSAPTQYDGTPSAEKARHYIELAVTEGSIVFEWLHRRPDGELWDAEVHLMSFTAGDRCLLQFNLQDITERRRAAAALQHHQSMLARTEQVAQVGSWEWDAATDTVRWSAELFRLFQLNPAEGAPSFAEHAKLFLPEDLKRLQTAAATALSQGTPYELELHGLRRDGEIRVFLANGHSEQGPGRPAMRLFGSLQDITERVQTLQALQESEAKFATAFRASPVPMAIRDLGTDHYVDVNDRCVAMMGYTREEIVGHAPLEIGWMAPEDQEKNRHALSTDGSVTDRELHLRRKDGTEVICTYSAHIIQVGGRPCVLSSTIDITARQRAETLLQRSEALFRRTFDEAPVGSAIVGLDRTFQRVNSALCRFLGYAAAELLGMSFAQVTHPDDIVDSASHIRQLLGGEISSFEFEKRYCRKDGGVVWGRVSVSLVRDIDGRPLHLVPIIQDITARKQAEATIQEAERFVRSTIDALDVHLCVLDEKGVVLTTNRAWDLFAAANGGTPAKTGIGTNYLQACAEAVGPTAEGAAAVAAGIRSVLAGTDATFAFEYPCDAPDVRRWFACRVTPFATPGALRVVVTHENITERERAQRALLESERRYATTLTAVNDGLWEWHVPSGNAYFSPSYYSLLGYAADAFVANYANWRTLVHPEDLARVESDLQMSVSTVRGFAIDLRMKTRTGDWLWVATRGNAVERDAAGQVLRMAGTLSDITQRKQAEQELEQFFALVPDMVCIASGDGYFRKLNDEWVRVLGYSKEELMAVPYTEFIHPEDRAATRHESAQEAAGNFTANFINRYRAKDGSYRWFEWNATSTNEKDVLFAAARDITKHRLAEDALRESEEKFAKVFHDAPVWIAITDLETACYLDINDEALRASGFSRDEVIGHTAAELGWITTGDRAGLIQALRQRGRFSGVELTFRTKAGGQLHGLINGEQITLGGRPRLLTVTIDITQRRQAEQSLRESEEKFAKVFHAAPAWVGITDLATATYVDINEEALRLSGFTREEVIGHTSAELGWINAEDHARLVQNVREHGRVIGLELTVHDKAGRPLNGWLSSELISIGGRASMLTIIVDITERKRAEELIAWEAALVENSSDVCSIKDLNLRVRAVNKAFLDSAGAATAAEVLGKTDSEIFQRPGNEANIEGYMADERRAQTLPPGEYISRLETMLRPDGTEQTLLTRKFPVFNSSGQLIATANISSDVTEHQRLEEALHNNERRYRQLFASNVAGVALHEIVCDAAGHPCDYRFLEVNPAFERLIGRPATDLEGHTVLEIMPQTEPIWIERYGLVALTGEATHFEQYSAVLNRHYEVTAYCPQPGQFAALTLDITERKRAEDALRESEEKNRLLIRHLHAGVVVHAPNTEILLANEQASTLLGLTIDQMHGKAAIDPSWGFVREDETPMPLAEFPVSRVLATRAPLRDQVLGINHPGAGARTWGLVNAFPNFDATGELHQVVVTFIDITERKRAEDALRDSLREKEALLKEVHHRVKNNLQVISSLLRLESGRVADPATLSVLRDMQNRIRTMALLHESLYRSGNLAEVDMKAYLETLCQQLFRAASARSTGPVELQMAVTPMRLDLNRTVPCGLIVNELVSNCLKHAFPSGRGGRVRVELQPAAVPDEWRLRVVDNGVGLPAGFTLENLPSLGLQLVSDLARQLQGRLEIAPPHGPTAPNSGTVFTVYFNALPPEARPAT